MTNKMTKRDYFNRLLTIVAGDVELEQFITHEIELLDKKSSGRKPTKDQKENVEIKKEILSVLSDGGNMTVTEIQKNSEILGELSNQKVSALLRQLVEAGKVVKTTDKKKSYFSLA
jgi:predicted transcriptional regulator